jgi:serine/threonine protein kinase
MAVGTPQYMSPEQAAGEEEIDGRSDIYSLGCVLYEMLVGEPPFTGRTTQAVIAKRFAGVVPSVRVVRPPVPVEVERVAFRALALAPEDRFQTGGELATALRCDS